MYNGPRIWGAVCQTQRQLDFFPLEFGVYVCMRTRIYAWVSVWMHVSESTYILCLRLECVHPYTCLNRCVRTGERWSCHFNGCGSDKKRKCPLTSLSISQHKSNAYSQSFPEGECPLVSVFIGTSILSTPFMRHILSGGRCMGSLQLISFSPHTSESEKWKGIRGIEIQPKKGPHKMLPFGSTHWSIRES